MRPAREVDAAAAAGRLRAGVRAATQPVRDDGARRGRGRVGVEPEVELVPDAELLRLGPPHKIPRVSDRDEHGRGRSGASGRYDGAATGR